jgi:hypothetical protein
MKSLDLHTIFGWEKRVVRADKYLGLEIPDQVCEKTDFKEDELEAEDEDTFTIARRKCWL